VQHKHDQALAGQERSLGRDHPDIATVNNIALVDDNQGDYSKALELLDRALAEREMSLGRDHPRTLGTVNNMASVYGNQGDYNKVLELLNRALAGKEKSLGRDHPPPSQPSTTSPQCLTTKVTIAKR
jgi:tetratricopeptide (TPR) repeat protein